MGPALPADGHPDKVRRLHFTALVKASAPGGMRVLIALYSRSGRTRAMAQALGEALDAPVVEITDARARIRGVAGFVEATFGALLGRLPALAVGAPDPSRYDLVIAAAPVWLGRLANPMRSWLAQNHGRITRLVVMATSGSGKLPGGAWADAAKISGAPLLTSACIGEARIDDGHGLELVRQFAGELRAKLNKIKPSENVT
jgi:hypothetical protein